MPRKFDINVDEMRENVRKATGLPDAAAPVIADQLGRHLATALHPALAPRLAKALGLPPQPGVASMYGTNFTDRAPADEGRGANRAHLDAAAEHSLGDVDPTTPAWHQGQAAYDRHPIVVAARGITPSESGNLGVGDGGRGGNLTMSPRARDALSWDRRDYGRQPSTPPAAGMKTVDRATRRPS